MEKTSGKVRDIYDLDDCLLIVTSNRVSAFDNVLPATIPNKGRVLNKLSEFWFKYTEDIIPNHMISTKYEEIKKVLDEDQLLELQPVLSLELGMLVKKLKMLPIECIVRGYITGSGWESYKKTASVCGIGLPQGLRESQKLPIPIYTPTTKATEGHDEHITFTQTIDLVGEKVAKELKEKSIEIYSKCAEYAAEKGIIIADTKFEFGIDEDGVLTLADEVLTPDSSRFWPADEYEVGKPQKSFDKQYLRDWLKEKGFDKTTPPSIPENVIGLTSSKYIQAYEMLTGEKFFQP